MLQVRMFFDPRSKDDENYSVYICDAKAAFDLYGCWLARVKRCVRLTMDGKELEAKNGFEFLRRQVA